ncbi:peptidylprolyl isomerase, partial [candidate division WOR-3 bacterium]|nr:peptidylprolyl isomerase [candidate division WOR-3 bacterium]
ARAKVKIIECKTEEEAKKARERLMKGEEFAHVAKEVSIHQSSARGGSLGWIRKEQHKELDQKVFTTTLNKITTPFHISLGWCILIVEDRKKERTKPLDEVRRQVISELKTQARQKIKDQLIEQLKEKFTVDIKEHKAEIPVT